MTMTYKIKDYCKTTFDKGSKVLVVSYEGVKRISYPHISRYNEGICYIEVKDEEQARHYAAFMNTEVQKLYIDDDLVIVI